MELSNIQYFNDQFEGDLNAFFCDGMIGLQNLKSGKKTMPCFDHVIISSKYVFVDVENLRGLLDKDLCLLLPPIYQEIYPVKKIDRESYINSCLLKEFDSTIICNVESNRPTHIAIQTIEADLGRPKFLAQDALNDDYLNGPFRENDKIDVYEASYDYEHIETSLFVFVSKNGNRHLFDMNSDSHIGRKNDIFFLWHYKENTFLHQDSNASFGFCTYRNGRLFRESFICPKQGDGIICYSPHILFHKNDFVSVCLPDINKRVGNTIYKNEKLSMSGRWALYKFGHRKTVFAWEEKEESYFQQLTPFAFSEPLRQMHDAFVFKCSEFGKEWLIKYDAGDELSKSTISLTDDDTEKAVALVDECMHSSYKPSLFDDFIRICFKGRFSISSPVYNNIDIRYDNMYDISTDEGYGLCDANMQVIIPPIYDNIIDDFEQLMIVSKGDRYGVINSHAEEIVPCRYDYIKIGKGEIPIWERECVWNDMLDQSESKWFISTRNDINSSDVDLMKEGYIIIGVIPRFPKVEKAGNNIFSELFKTLADKTNNNAVSTTPCDIYLPNGKFVANCRVSAQGGFEFDKEIGTLMVFDTFTSNNLKRYGIYVETSSCPVCTSTDESGDIYSLNGNLYEGYYYLEKLIITKDICVVKWNGLGRCNFKSFEVSEGNKIFQAIDGVLYTQKGYDRNGKTDRKHMIELVACPTNVKNHVVVSGTTRIANCAFKGSLIENLDLPDTLEEIGVNSFYLTPNLKHLKLPLSIRKIESQDVGMSGDASPIIEFNGHHFTNWEELFGYMLQNGFEKKSGNVIT